MNTKRGTPRFWLATALAACALAATALTLAPASATRAKTAPPAVHQFADPTGGHIQHVVMILQENRSFDSYFGTFPGADGIPMDASGNPVTCYPDPATGQCVYPQPNHADQNNGGPHSHAAYLSDFSGGAMNGWIGTAEARGFTPAQADTVVDYHTASDIPNYWSYATTYVLADHFYEAAASWSRPQHLFDVSGWSATCASQSPVTCTSSDNPRGISPLHPDPFAWTDLTYLLGKAGVSWGYYLDNGAKTTANPRGVPPIWNPLPGFTDVPGGSQSGNIQNLTSFYTQAAAGTLPAVSWIAPAPQDSEHPNALVSTGQAYVTNIVNAVMESPDWATTAIFLSWDDWGGFADHVPPVTVDSLGYGFRTPLVIISPWASGGTVDHQVLSSDAELKLIEDVFLGGQRIDPATDGRPDSRPSIREDAPQLGNLLNDFNFSQAPLPPDILSPCPPTTLVPPPVPPCTATVRLRGNWND